MLKFFFTLGSFQRAKNELPGTLQILNCFKIEFLLFGCLERAISINIHFSFTAKQGPTFIILLLFSHYIQVRLFQNSSCAVCERDPHMEWILSQL